MMFLYGENLAETNCAYGLRGRKESKVELIEN